jgi:long-subunit acyl-CoA synthetase (AMP-forming)
MPETVMAALAATARAHPGRIAFARKEAGAWRETTFAAYHSLVRRTARGLMALGARDGRNVVILSANRPEWLLASLGAAAAGSVAAGLYTTSAPQQCEYIAHHCEAVVAVVENEAHLRTFLAFRDRLPHLQAIVLIEGRSTADGVSSWDDMLRRGDEVAESELDERIAALDSSRCASLIYTSGTTGPPKAVMISHESLLWVSRTIARVVGIGPEDGGLCYLPLSHVAEQTLSLFGPVANGFATYFAESLEKVPETLREVRPSFFFGVPRVWEKMQAAIEARIAGSSPLRRRLLAWAREQGLRAGYADQRGEKRPFLHPLARALVFSGLRRRMGLDRARLCVVSAAPIAKDTLDFFLSLGIPVLEAYGMSECAGATTLSLPNAYRTGRAGRAMPGTEVRIADDGEILIRGPHVFLGYLKDEEATRAALDPDGSLHSGDVGELDADGYLHVTDRKKELIVTSGGKKTGPAVLESHLKHLPAVAQAVVVGDGRNYLAALFTLDPLRVGTVAAEAGSAARDVAAASVCPAFQAHLGRALTVANTHFARFETIKRFAVLSTEFSVDGGELTPTLKLKRRVIYEKYAAEIERLYLPGRS